MELPYSNILPTWRLEHRHDHTYLFTDCSASHSVLTRTTHTHKQIWCGRRKSCRQGWLNDRLARPQWRNYAPCEQEDKLWSMKSEAVKNVRRAAWRAALFKLPLQHPREEMRTGVNRLGRGTTIYFLFNFNLFLDFLNGLYKIRETACSRNALNASTMRFEMHNDKRCKI